MVTRKPAREPASPADALYTKLAGLQGWVEPAMLPWCRAEVLAGLVADGRVERREEGAPSRVYVRAVSSERGGVA